MNEDAILLAYESAKAKGYKKELSDFTTLIQTDESALNLAFEDAKSNGYEKELSDFSSLMGYGVDSSKKKSGYGIVCGRSFYGYSTTYGWCWSRTFNI